MGDPRLAIKLSQLRAVIAVANHGNFSEAGLSLDLSQSAVSHAIASLEAELGVMLFQRGRQGAVLTPVGERVVQRAEEVMAALALLVDEAMQERGLRGGRLRISSFRSVSAHFLPGVLVQFRQRYPQVEVTLTEREHYYEVEQDLRAARVEVGFLQLPVEDDLQTWEVLQDEYMVLVPDQSGEIPTEVGTISWEALGRYPLLTAGGFCTQWVVQHWQACGQTLTISQTVREDSTLVGMVAQGLGAGILPRLAAEPLPRGVRLYHMAIPLKRHIGMAIWTGAVHAPSVYAFVQTVLGLAQGYAYSLPTDK